MPEHARRVEDIGDAQSPGLELRRARCLHAIAPRKIEAGDMGPPGVDVGDEEMHHEIAGELFDKKVLQQKRVFPEADVGGVVSERLNLETEIGIEALAELEVLCGRKGA